MSTFSGGNTTESDAADKLKIPIDRWIASKTLKNYADKIIDLGIALEALYLHGINSKSELSFRLALHASRFLGKSKKERKELFEKVKAIYRCRSKIVHGNDIKLPVKVGEQGMGMYDLIEIAQDLCKKSILKILEDGKLPHWDDLIHTYRRTIR